MSELKKLGNQTIWYGLSNILSRLINYLVNPILTYLLNNPKGLVTVGEYSVLFSAIPLANVIFTYGMETAYFRFSSKSDLDKKKLFNVSFTALIISSIVLSFILFLFRFKLSQTFAIADHPEIITLIIGTILFDTLSTLPFAKLRQENRPRRYATIKFLNVLINLCLTVFLVGVFPKWCSSHPHSSLSNLFQHTNATGFIFIAIFIASLVTFLMLFRDVKLFHLNFDKPLLTKILGYGLPFIIIGFGGMINETFDRIMLQKLYVGTMDAAKSAVGIYSSNYKIAIFITLFIQAFRMAAEPFFFNKAADKNAPSLYAKVMKWFVITLCFAFLFNVLFLDIWVKMIGSGYRSGVGVVPLLIYANIALGIYYNLAVWYKITDQLKYGIYITLMGVLITLTINFAFIPKFGMYACAWATFLCYTTMMVVSYKMGQKHYPIPYNIRKFLLYFGTITLFYFLDSMIKKHWTSLFGSVFTGVLFFVVFIYFIVQMERKDLQKFPLIGKYL